MTTAKMLDKAIAIAGRKMPLLSRTTRNKNLELAADDMAEAYEIGVEECQREIVCRLLAVKAQLEVTS